MGCDQSTPIVENPSNSNRPLYTVGATEHGRSKRMTVGGTERMLSLINKKAAMAKMLEAEERISPKLNTEGQLMPEEVVKRTTSSPENVTVTIGSPGSNLLQIQYAYWTQQGWYPDDPHKANQDNFSITHKFAGEDSDIVFGVYDGHGVHGHDCATYAKENLPDLIAKYVRKKRVGRYQQSLRQSGKSVKGSFKPKAWPKLSDKEYEEACRKGFLKCNTDMHQNQEVNDKLSGTTAILACFHFGRLTVCNVGDSRAVLGHRIPGGEEDEEKREIEEEPASSTPGTLVAIPLSKDQTPYRIDERERVKKAGCSVLTVDQMEGNEPIHENWGDLDLGTDLDVSGDPPRVWAKGQDYPGCAFTRSLGDYIADSIGVYAEPEMLTQELTRNDEILVIATDGVFEFLTNQEVIDVCAQSESPLIACEQLAKASYAQWLRHEDRTDDITVIVCFMKCDADETAGSGTTAKLGCKKPANTASPAQAGGQQRKTDGRSLSLFVPKEGAEALQRRVLDDLDFDDGAANEEKKLADCNEA